MSVHCAILGESGAGKSTYIKRVLIPAYAKLGKPVCILDPIRQQWPGAAWVTHDPLLFAKHMRGMRGCVCVLDEMRRLTSTYEWAIALSYFALEARNDGHLSFFAGQRLVHLPPDFRDQCGTFYLFYQKKAGAERLAKEYDDSLMETTRLPIGTCLVYNALKTPYKIKVFDPPKA